MDLTKLRVGSGFDVHSFASDPNRTLVLGGVEFELPGLAAHSDGDVICHAVIDALLGPTPHGDIGQLFSDTSEKTKGAGGLELLKDVVGRITTDSWSVLNVDVTVIADQPKLAPVKSQIETNVAEIVGAPVTVKGKRTEGVHHQIPGISCLATALLVAP